MIRLYTDMQRSWVKIGAVVILCLFCRHSFKCGAIKTTSLFHFYLFLDSSSGALYDSQFKIILIYVIMGLGLSQAGFLLTDCLSQTQVLEREARSQSLRGSYYENPLFLTSYKAKSRLTIWNQAYRTVCRLMCIDSIK